MSRLFVGPGDLEAMRDSMARAGLPRLLARRAGRAQDRLHAASGEMFPELPTWLRLALALARAARIPRQEALVRAAVLRLLGDPLVAEAWVATPLDDFGGRTPLHMARTADGVTKVHVLVARLERERAAEKGKTITDG